ncbi:TPA: hypothetical protein ACGOWT_002109, partial [Streptococcus suis]
MNLIRLLNNYHKAIIFISDIYVCFAAQRTCIIHGGLLGKEIIIFNEIKTVHYITNVLFFVT